MADLDTGPVIGLIVAVVSVATIAARIIEKLVDRVIEDRKKSSESTITPKKGGYTSDLAIQKHVIQSVHDDIEKTRNDLSKMMELLRDSKEVLHRDLPRMLEQMNTQHKMTHDNMNEFRKVFSHLESALDGNTAATNKLYSLLANMLKSGR